MYSKADVANIRTKFRVNPGRQYKTALELGAGKTIKMRLHWQLPSPR